MKINKKARIGWHSLETKEISGMTHKIRALAHDSLIIHFLAFMEVWTLWKDFCGENLEVTKR